MPIKRIEKTRKSYTKEDFNGSGKSEGQTDQKAQEGTKDRNEDR
jgi:hypothetical protein